VLHTQEAQPVAGKRQREEDDTAATATATGASSWAIVKAVSSFLFAKLTPVQQQ
jgi:hypothetical protein